MQPDRSEIVKIADYTERLRSIGARYQTTRGAEQIFKTPNKVWVRVKREGPERVRLDYYFTGDCGCGA